jgi:hypothetical protein
MSCEYGDESLIVHRNPQILLLRSGCFADHSIFHRSLLQLSSTLVTDVVLTVTMAWGLWRSRTGWSDTDRLINRLIR